MWLYTTLREDEEGAVAAQILYDPHFIGCSTELIACPVGHTDGEEGKEG
jgi:hypothetical protein